MFALSHWNLRSSNIWKAWWDKINLPVATKQQAISSLKPPRIAMTSNLLFQLLLVKEDIKERIFLKGSFADHQLSLSPWNNECSLIFHSFAEDELLWSRPWATKSCTTGAAAPEKSIIDNFIPADSDSCAPWLQGI